MSVWWKPPLRAGERRRVWTAGSNSLMGREPELRTLLETATQMGCLPVLGHNGATWFVDIYRPPKPKPVETP